MGTFKSEDFSQALLSPGLAWDVDYVGNSVLLKIIAAGVTGDYNNNGIVDAADFVVWRDNNGTNTVLPNDPLGGTIGSGQYNQWRAHFGQTAGAGAGAGLAGAAVPEPASVALLLATIFALGIVRFRTNGQQDI